MNLKQLSDLELHLQTEKSALREREANTTLLHHLHEIERRRLYAKHGCSSLLDYCVRVLKMSEPQAARRVNAARVLGECPEIEEKINTGALTLTSISQAQAFFRKEEKIGNPASGPEKFEVIQKLINKPTREVERILLSYSSEPNEKVKESARAVSENETKLTLAADLQLMQDLDRLKEIWSHEMPNASYSDIIRKMARLCRKKFDPLEKAQRAHGKQRSATPAPELSLQPPRKQAKRLSRNIPAKINRAIWLRDRGVCTYVDTKSGRACNSRHKLEIDHIKPFAHGGDHSMENLRLRCFTHNQWHAIQSFGTAVSRFSAIRRS